MAGIKVRVFNKNDPLHTAMLEDINTATAAQLNRKNIF